MTARSIPEGEIPGALPRNFARSCLLLLIAEQPSHGYDLLERMSRLGLDASDPGGLYRSLRSMEREELVTSHWETSATGPARRVYRLLPAGRAALDESAAALTETQAVLAAYLARHASLRPEARTPAADRWTEPGRNAPWASPSPSPGQTTGA
ncbi:MAG: helix-turn-helix transcriptional regulator, partial [Chloroflexi bacterium]|nr:helix-turn-helix transcriptional regulator [Chloroflexota bacterium]